MEITKKKKKILNRQNKRDVGSVTEGETETERQREKAKIKKKNGGLLDVKINEVSGRDTRV